MTLKPVEVRVLITELPTLVEQKSKRTDFDDRPKPMSLPILVWSKLEIQGRIITVCNYSKLKIKFFSKKNLYSFSAMYCSVEEL